MMQSMAVSIYRLNAAYKLRNNGGTGAGVSSALDPIGKEKSERITANLSWADPQFAQNWGLGYTASYLHYYEDASNYNLYPPGTKFPNYVVPDAATASLLGVPIGTTISGLFPNGMIGSPARWEQQLRIFASATYSGFVNHSLRLGLGHDDLNLYKTRTIKNFWLSANGTPVPNPVSGGLIDYSGIQPHLLPHDRKVDYLYAQDEWNFAHDWTFTAGVRHDNYSDFGGTTKTVCLAYLPDMEIGEYTIVHAGFAITRLDEASANETLQMFADLGILAEELGVEELGA